MEPKFRGYRSCRNLGLLTGLALFFLGSFSTLSAQESKAIIPSIIEPTLSQGQKFQLVYRLPGQVSTAEFFWSGPTDFLQVMGPVEFRPVISDAYGETSELSTDMVMPFKALVPGYQLVPRLRINAGGVLLNAEELLLPVSVPGKPLAIPPVLSWTIADQDIYEGMSILITLMMSKTKTLLIPRSIEYPAITGGIFEEVEGSARSSTESVAGENLLNMPLVTFMLTPSQAGEISLPPTLVRFKDFDIALEGKKLNVLPLPEELKTFGALGEFSSSITFDTDTMYENEAFTAIVRIDGRGNLNFLKMPSLDTGDFMVQGIQTISNYEPGVEGYRGYREERYRLLSGKSGIHTLRLGDFEFFEPATATTSWIDGRTVKVNVAPARKLADLKKSKLDMPDAGMQEELSHEFALVPLAVAFALFACILVLFKGRLEGKKYFLVALSLGLVLFSLLGTELFRKYQADERVRALFSDQSSPPDITALSNALKTDKTSPLLWYALAVRQYEITDKSAALYALVQAQEFSDSENLLTRRLDLMEEMGLTQELTVRPWFLAPPALALACLLLVFAVLLVRLKALMPALILFACSFMLVTAHVVSFVSQYGEYALVRQTGAPLRKIPERTSKSWIELTGGLGVAIKARFDGYALVETSYNVLGWVDETDLHILNQEVPEP